MFVDLLGSDPVRTSFFNTVVAPRPIAWVSTLNESGVPNLAPFSYFNLLTSSPATTIFSCTSPSDRAEKDTLANVKATGEFVINLVSREMLHVMHATSAMAPAGVDEFSLVGIEQAGSVNVAPPRVAAAPAALECRVLQYVDIEPEREGQQKSTAVIGRVVGLYIAPAFIDTHGRFDSVKARLMSRLGGPQYAELGEITELATLVHSH